MKKAVFVLLLALSSASMQADNKEQTRGIGIYPGLPSQYFGPEMRVSDTYRNIALHRMAYHSSSINSNQTAQLVTDGIITDQMPYTLSVSTADTVFSSREKEYTLDEVEWTNHTMNGEDAWLEYHFQHHPIAPDAISLQSNIAYYEKKRDGHYDILVEGSNDHKTWTVLYDQVGDTIKWVKPWMVFPLGHYQSDKNDGYRITQFDQTLPLVGHQAYSYIRLHIRMKGTKYWRVNQTDFLQNGQKMPIAPYNHFTSAWMSGGTGEEWVYVDLGAKASFDHVNLYWVNQSPKAGKIQVSDDARNWSDIASLSNNAQLKDEIACKGQGRYVRVLMQQSANESPYVLSEMQVIGRDGLQPVAHEQAPQQGNRITLSGGNWRLQRASEVSAEGELIASPDYDDRDWVLATVPGTVLASYMNIGAVPNPNYADNISQISDSWFCSNFWYRDVFELPADYMGKHIQLHLNGVNWKANIYLNGHKLARQEGAYIRGIYDVTHLLKTGTNYLAVEIIRNEHYGSIKEKNGYSTDFNGGPLGADDPTFNPSIGWDWITTVRGRNIGIWNEVFLTLNGGVTVSDPLVQTTLEDGKASMTASVVVRNENTYATDVVVKGQIGQIQFQQPIRLIGGEERTIEFLPEKYSQLASQQMKLWWPNGYGEPYLYDASFTAEVNNQAVDKCSFKAGIRQMTYDTSDNILKIYINGRRFIGRGGNWGFPEHNLLYRAREYDEAVGYHADQNFTMIRNWVGQIGDEAFFDACDRHGIMVWQDFWLANPADGFNPTNESMFMKNAQDVVRNLRHHPSIALYCGRNEGNPPASLDKALQTLISQQHSDIIYFPSSADGVVSGRGPYYALQPSEYFKIKNGQNKFHSERGMPCVMNYESLARTLSPEGLWPRGEEWGKHDFTSGGAQRGNSFNGLISKMFKPATNAKEFTDGAQWINYNGYRAMFESRSIQRKGLLLWMTHPTWPSMVWQTYDYYLDPTAAFFASKKANEPLHLQWNSDKDEVELVNYSAGTRQVKAVAQIFDMNGQPLWNKDVELSSKEDTTLPCFKPEWTNAEVQYLKLTLYENNKLIGDNFYVRGKEESNYQALTQLSHPELNTQFKYTEKEGVFTGVATISNSTKAPALFVRLNLVDAADADQILPVHYTDNYICLMPGETRQIVVSWKSQDMRSGKVELKAAAYN